MSVCKQCNKGFSCGCQKTKAKDGSIVHKSCLTAYENKNKARPPFGGEVTKILQNGRSFKSRI
tara:strand:+ start:167 stop:355 length:189 start_codon:yes stop_codon:yes gene_type:complete